MGANRTPFPAAAGKDNVAEVAFSARPGETKARIHFGLKTPGEAIIKKIYVEELDPAENLLLNPAIRWRTADIGGTQSKLVKKTGSYMLEKTKDGVHVDRAPGKHFSSV